MVRSTVTGRGGVSGGAQAELGLCDDVVTIEAVRQVGTGALTTLYQYAVCSVQCVVCSV